VCGSFQNGIFVKKEEELALESSHSFVSSLMMSGILLLHSKRAAYCSHNQIMHNKGKPKLDKFS